MDITKDIQAFLDEKKTGEVPPKPVEYEAYVPQFGNQTSYLAAPSTRTEASSPIAGKNAEALRASSPAAVKLTNQKSHEKPVARAIYDYAAQEDGELGFVADDTITVSGQVNEDWLIGECKGRKGKFPANYVEITKGSLAALKTSDATPTASTTTTTAHPPTAATTTTTTATAKTDMTTTTTTTTTTSATAAKSIARNEAPSSSTAASTPPSKTTAPSSSHASSHSAGGSNRSTTTKPPTTTSSATAAAAGGAPPSSSQTPSLLGRKAKALYDFDGKEADELPVKEGDVITIRSEAEEWYLAVSSVGKEGLLPKAYVELI